MEKEIIEKYKGKMVTVRDNFHRVLPSGNRIAYVDTVYPRKGMLRIVLVLGEKYKVKIGAIKEVLGNPKPKWWGDPKKAVKTIKFKKKR